VPEYRNLLAKVRAGTITGRRKSNTWIKVLLRRTTCNTYILTVGEAIFSGGQRSGAHGQNNSLTIEVDETKVKGGLL